MKKIWVTALASYKEEVHKLMSLLKPYGLDVKGAFYEDDLERLSWIKERDGIIDRGTALWLILASGSDLIAPSIRYGLSLLSLTVLAKRGLHFPRMIATVEREPCDSASLPTALKGAECISLTNPALASKTVARAHAPAGEIAVDYRLDTHGSHQIGQWFEVGPEKGSWDGCMFGVEGAQIVFHAAGPKGGLPDRATLNYPSKGLEVKLGDRTYVTWAARNELTSELSYFVKVEGYPASIIFGPYAGEDEAEIYKLQLI